MITKTRKTIAERQNMVAALRERLEEFTDDLDEAEVALITSTWDGYSERNALLIAMQRPGATDVAGFRAWQVRGRCVRRGEKGIQILAPAGQGEATTDDNGEETPGRLRFRVAYVFDVAQTDQMEETDHGRQDHTDD
jgi:antirestriction protein ArdC